MAPFIVYGLKVNCFFNINFPFKLNMAWVRQLYILQSKIIFEDQNTYGCCIYYTINIFLMGLVPGNASIEKYFISKGELMEVFYIDLEEKKHCVCVCGSRKYPHLPHAMEGYWKF